MSSYKSYPAYKDSKLDWLGNVPEHWPIIKGKWEWQKETRPIRKEDDIVTAFRDGQVTLRKNRREDGFTIASMEHGYQGIRKGDLVIHGMDAFAGAIGVSDSNGKSSPVYSACTPKKESNPQYFAYLLKEMSKKGWIESLAKGIRERSTEFKFPEFSNLQYPIPPKSEQTAIAQFLDRKTAEIKAFIELKEKTIALLKERKTAIINQAVTKGLDPNVEMKDSGVEWLGEIPEHWEVRPIKYFLRERVQRSKTGNGTLLMISQVHGLVERAKYHEKAEAAETTEGHKECLLDDLVFNKLKAHLGVFFKSTFDGLGLISPDYAVYIGAKFIDTKFYELLFRHPSYLAIFTTTVTGIVDGLKRLYTSDLFHIKAPMPPLHEQLEILEFIKNKALELDQSISNAENEIALIKEYQQSLISEAVTGKIDVRTEVNINGEPKTVM